MSEPDSILAAETGRDYESAIDEMQSDMARHQRDYAGGEVTATANQALAIATIERLAKEHTEQAGKLQPLPPPPPAPVHTVEQREIEGKKYTLDKSPTPDRPYRTASEFERDVMRHAMPRIEHLLTLHETGPLGQPSWHTRTMAATFFKVRSLEARMSGRYDLADEYEQRFQLDLYELLEESNKVFGDWRSDPEQKLFLV